MRKPSLLFFCLLFMLATSAQKISLNNTYSASFKKGYFDWTVFVNADAATLNSIDHVEYLLDPSFPKPQVSSNNRNTNFGYKANGWGEFEIKAKVFFKDKRKAVLYLTYWLSLKPKIYK